jgi:hypothetical protein
MNANTSRRRAAPRSSDAARKISSARWRRGSGAARRFSSLSSSKARSAAPAQYNASASSDMEVEPRNPRVGLSTS